MDRGSGTLSKQMADFVIVCIIRQYTHSQRKNNEPRITSPSISLRYGTAAIVLELLSVCYLSVRSSVCLSACLPDELVIVVIFRLNRAFSAGKRHVYSQRCGCN